MNRKLSQSGAVILVAAAIMTLASFLPFWDSRLPGGVDFTAWTSDFILYPITILPVVSGLVMGLHILVSTFTAAKLPRRILGITWNQVHLILGLQAAVMMLAFLMQEHGVFLVQYGVGFYLMLLAGIGLAIGALLRERELLLP